MFKSLHCYQISKKKMFGPKSSVGGLKNTCTDEWQLKDGQQRKSFVFFCKPKEIGKTRSNKMLKKQQNKASPAEECHKCKNDPSSELQVKAATNLKAFLRGGLLMGRAGCKDSFAITITGQTLNCFHLCLSAIISYWRLSNLCTNINQAGNRYKRYSSVYSIRELEFAFVFVFVFAL